MISCFGQTRLCVFFFFQAEDGIRDYKVTGVQTCALPIYDAARARLARFDPRAALVPYPDARGALERARARRLRTGVLRSEERRVGKSVDLGGRRIIKKKKTNPQSAHEYEAQA